MQPTFFANQNEFRKWLANNHISEAELLVGFYKVGSSMASMTWSQSVDQALCFGWIDGIRKSIDTESYSIRFTPRKKASIWSAINIKKMEELTKAGLMTAKGLEAYSFRTESKSKIYSHERALPAKFDEDFEIQFKKNKIAWNYFSSQAPSYQKVITHWIMSAKQEKTRKARLEKTIYQSAQLKRVL